MSRKITLASGEGWALFCDMDYPDTGLSMYLDTKVVEDWKWSQHNGVLVELTPEIVEAIKSAVPFGT